jgi:methyltransferase
MVIPYLAFLALVAGERISEVVRSRKNAARAFARGGIESCAGQIVLMKLLHGSFFAACALEVILLDRPFLPWLGMSMLTVSVAAQAIRYWAVHSLGERWNVRVIVIPGMPLVTGGPYRFLRHPNYLAVVLEMFAIPLIHTAYLTALVFSFLNGVLLHRRIRCEERALGIAA